jgi:SP family general alpha glucoside:H+ symporter-like MFS transporter
MVLINSLFAMPAFQKSFGSPIEGSPGEYEVSAAWQTGISNGALIGEILGLFFAGWLTERYGYKRTMIGALSILAGFVFILFFAQDLPMLLVGEILCGIPWGVFQTLTCTYAAEVCPVKLRPYLTTYVNLCWVLGQFLSSGVLKGVSTLPATDPWAYKIPFALQWFWPIPLITGIAFAPESPWWLVRRDRIEDAKHALLRLTSRDQKETFDADETMNMIIYTNEFEKAQQEGTSYKECFRGRNLRRTEIVCVTWAVQTFCGSTFMGYSTYFYEAAGLDSSMAFSLSLGQYGLGAIGTLSSWWLMSKFGRRTLYLWGAIIMAILLFTIGCMGLISQSNTAAQWAIGSLLLIYTYTYDTTVGPVCYSLISELSSTRLRNKTVVLARNFYNITGISTNVLTPMMLNPTAWNWGAKAGFFWAGTCTVCAVWIFVRLPEPKGRTYAELDMLFEEKVSARDFSKTIVNPFEKTVFRESSPAPAKEDLGVEVIETAPTTSGQEKV